MVSTVKKIRGGVYFIHTVWHERDLFPGCESSSHLSACLRGTDFVNLQAEIHSRHFNYCL